MGVRMSKYSFKIDVFEKVDRLVNPETGVIHHKGQSFDETNNISVSELIPFIKRDIFLAIKQNLLPEMKIRLKAQTYKTHSNIMAIIEKSSKNLFAEPYLESLQQNSTTNTSGFFVSEFPNHRYSSDGWYILGKLAQILWQYNFSSYCGEYDCYQRRFTYQITPSNKLLEQDPCILSQLLENKNNEDEVA
jgi:hypothetical protein